MADLPRILNRKIVSYMGEEFTGHNKHLEPTNRAYWCECCEAYSVWPGADWGASHYFCDDCLAMLELGQGLTGDALFRHEWAVMLWEEREPGHSNRALIDGKYSRKLYQAINHE